MADWKDIGVDNFRTAVLLFEDKKYRSATSRFYYAAFSVITHELIQRNAGPDFAQGRVTPSHAQVSTLIDQYFVHFSEERRRNFARRVNNIYRDRLAADYSLLRIDKAAAKETYRLTESIFRYLGASYEQK